MDYDPQGSSLHWLRVRAGSAARIYGANAAPQRGGRIRSVEMHVAGGHAAAHRRCAGRHLGSAPPGNAEQGRRHPHPGGAVGDRYPRYGEFRQGLLLVGRIRTRNIQLAVVANRVRSSMPVYQPLERFLNSLGLPFLTRISDSDVYVKAAESGIGIFEMASSAAAAECSEFMPIVDWVGRQRDSVVSGTER